MGGWGTRSPSKLGDNETKSIRGAGPAHLSAEGATRLDVTEGVQASATTASASSKNL